MSSRNLLMALAVAMVFSVIADHYRGAHAIATERVLRLPPMRAALPDTAPLTEAPRSYARLSAIQTDLRAEHRDQLARGLARAQRVALADAAVRLSD